jgi:immunoglobulin-binding protein 1
VGAWDEEDERRLWAAQLEAAALRALDALPLLEQEAALLAHAAQQQQQHGGGPPGGSSSARQQEAGHDSRQRAQPRAAEQQQQQQQQMMHRLADIAGQLSLGRDRQALHRQVLRPGHILPTLTVEQQGDVEVAQARARDRAAKEAAAAKAAAAADARSDDEDEAALAKQRAWDDWADDNPRGWGNSKLRPCA